MPSEKAAGKEKEVSESKGIMKLSIYLQKNDHVLIHYYPCYRTGINKQG